MTPTVQEADFGFFIIVLLHVWQPKGRRNDACYPVMRRMRMQGRCREIGGTCLAVRKDAHVVPVHRRLHQVPRVLKHLRSGHALVTDMLCMFWQQVPTPSVQGSLKHGNEIVQKNTNQQVHNSA